VPLVGAPGFSWVMLSTGSILGLVHRLFEIVATLLWAELQEGVLHFCSNVRPLVDGMDILGVLSCWRSGVVSCMGFAGGS